ncbi:cell wall hydrolase [Streptomyces sp. NPDC050161]|uniref:cell wall hydrolase n=1 Tax=Streptomyces sp. NPDC050161 TaxID=3365604 RepID=UPI00378E62FA
MPPETRPAAPGPYGPDPFGRLPAALRNVAYSAARHPGAGSPDEASPTARGGGDLRTGGGSPGAPDLSGGANCQRYAYAVLHHFGLWVPPLRSAELWADVWATYRVDRPGPLDLLLFDGGPVAGRPEGYGAHVGVQLGPDQVLHLCKEVGRPVVWCAADFAARTRYARLLGAKRVRERVRPPGL